MRGPTDHNIAVRVILDNLKGAFSAIDHTEIEAAAGVPVSKERYERVVALIIRKIERYETQLKKS